MTSLVFLSKYKTGFISSAVSGSIIDIGLFKFGVYLNSLYYTGLTKFLGSIIKKNKERLNYTYYLSEKEVKKRQLFLEQNIKVWEGHWGAYWQLLTYPEVNSIIFDKEMEYAKVFFRIVYEGGEALLKKENGKWGSSLW